MKEAGQRSNAGTGRRGLTAIVLKRYAAAPAEGASGSQTGTGKTEGWGGRGRRCPGSTNVGQRNRSGSHCQCFRDPDTWQEGIMESRWCSLMRGGRVRNPGRGKEVAGQKPRQKALSEPGFLNGGEI